MSASLAFPGAAGELALLLLRATLLMGAAWAAAAALRTAGASAAARHVAWLAGIAALLALPVLWLLVPAVSLPILPADAAGAAASALSPPTTAAPPTGASLPTGVPSPAGWSFLLLAAYALGAATLLLRLIVGRRTLKRLWSDAGPVEDPAWEKLLCRLSAEIGLARSAELRISRGPAVPMTWGTLAPKLLLPAEAVQWPPERRRLVLLHELAHVARRDSFSRSLASLVCALYWFHPGAWLAARQMRLEQEHAADDRVLTAGGSAQAYALSLLHLAKRQGARPRFDQAAAMAGMYQLERRLVSITSESRRNPPGAIFLSSSALLGGLTTWFVAAGAPVGATPALPDPFQARGTNIASAAATASNPLRLATPSERPARAGRILSQAVRESRSAGPEPDPRPFEDLTSDRPAATRPSASEPADRGVESSQDRPRPQPALAQPLRNYGWELPRRGFQAPAESPEDSPRLARLTPPDASPAASKDRIRLPKWARNAPRLSRGRPPTGSNPSAQGPVVLSWSLDVVGGK